MSDPERRERIRNVATRVGIVASAFTVFTAGWIAMKSNDWRTVTVVTILALAAGVIASGLSARRRR
jgi:predicted transcriptional regulator